ncbi:MAG: hypothetical protein ABI683_09890 [Ginsengibacter sp.]
MHLRRLHFVAFAILVIGCFFACEIKDRGPGRITFASPLSYNQFIVDRHKELIADVDIYNLAMEHDYAVAMKTLDSILLHASQSLSDVSHMAPFKGDSSFREVSEDFFKYYSGQFIDEGKELIELKSKADSGRADYDEITTLVQLSKKVDAHANTLQLRLQEMQRRFASKNNFILSK